MVGKRGDGANEVETYLLLCALLSSGDSRRDESARALAGSGVRAALIALADRQRVLAALHEAVCARWAGQFDRAERMVLATRHEQNRRRNGTLRDALIEVGGRAGERGFEITALKGAAWILGDARGLAAWRNMIDLDVLVAPEHFEAMPDLLLKSGYAPLHQRRLIGRRQNRDHFHLVPYTDSARGVTIEVHRTIGFRPDLLPNALAFSGPSTPHGGLRLPPPWFAALHAMVHWQIHDDAYRTGGGGIREIVETARHLQRSDVDWDSVADHARRGGALAECAAAVAFAQRLLGASAPPALRPSDASQSRVRRSLLLLRSPLRARIASEQARNARLWRGDRTVYKLSRRGLGLRKAALVIALYRLALAPVVAVRWFALSAAESAVVLLGLVAGQGQADRYALDPARPPP